jgi:hypothetical protein
VEENKIAIVINDLNPHKKGPDQKWSSLDYPIVIPMSGIMPDVLKCFLNCLKES